MSCGCLKLEKSRITSLTHGMSRTPIHNVWLTMRRRCDDPKTKAFKDYGGRGIKVCKRWEKFENFLEDMGSPEKGMTIERLNNDFGYYKENCVWTTKEAQANNRRSNKLIEFDGETLTQAQWEKKVGLRTGQLYARLSKGWSVERALLTPRAIPRAYVLATRP